MLRGSISLPLPTLKQREIEIEECTDLEVIKISYCSNNMTWCKVSIGKRSNKRSKHHILIFFFLEINFHVAAVLFMIEAPWSRGPSKKQYSEPKSMGTIHHPSVFFLLDFTNVRPWTGGRQRQLANGLMTLDLMYGLLTWFQLTPSLMNLNFHAMRVQLDGLCQVIILAPAGRLEMGHWSLAGLIWSTRMPRDCCAAVLRPIASILFNGSKPFEKLVRDIDPTWFDVSQSWK